MQRISESQEEVYYTSTIFIKNKGDVQSCSNYRCVKLISHSMKSCKRVVEDKLRVEVITT